MIKEELLHHIWKFKLFNTNNLYTQQEEKLKIIHTGVLNTDSGPDFFNSKIQLNNTTWVGNIEIHIKSSDWDKHNHGNDKAYNNVILHVVYIDDKPIYNANKSTIPTLELKELLQSNFIDNYTNLNTSKDWVPCANQVKNIDQFIIENWLERVVIERLERKSDEILKVLQQNKNNWEETFYYFLFKYYGLNVNSFPFSLIAKNTPLKIIDKHHNLSSIEALFFGQAGFLEDEKINDEYYLQLKKEYKFLKSKFELISIDKSLWKFSRLRPSNFPTIRISQLSNLLFKNSRLFSNVLNSQSIKDLEKIFTTQASIYWKNHYQFSKEVKTSKPKNIGITTINNLIINVVVPILFIYAKEKDDENLKEKALKYLQLLPSEKNNIIEKWINFGLQSNNAMQSQALIELKKNYCSQKKCLNCSIGNNIIRND